MLVINYFIAQGQFLFVLLIKEKERFFSDLGLFSKQAKRNLRFLVTKYNSVIAPLLSLMFCVKCHINYKIKIVNQKTNGHIDITRFFPNNYFSIRFPSTFIPTCVPNLIPSKFIARIENQQTN